MNLIILLFLYQTYLYLEDRENESVQKGWLDPLSRMTIENVIENIQQVN